MKYERDVRFHVCLLVFLITHLFMMHLGSIEMTLHVINSNAAGFHVAASGWHEDNLRAKAGDVPSTVTTISTETKSHFWELVWNALPISALTAMLAYHLLPKYEDEDEDEK